VRAAADASIAIVRLLAAPGEEGEGVEVTATARLRHQANLDCCSQLVKQMVHDKRLLGLLLIARVAEGGG